MKPLSFKHLHSKYNADRYQNSQCEIELITPLQPPIGVTVTLVNTATTRSETRSALGAMSLLSRLRVPLLSIKVLENYPCAGTR